MLHTVPVLDGGTKLVLIGITFAFFYIIFACTMRLIPDPDEAVEKKMELARRASSTNRESVAQAAIGFHPPEVQEMIEGVARKLHITIDQCMAYYTAFNHYDVDGSGAVNASELKMMLKNSIGFVPSDEEIDSLVRDVDSDGSGSLEFYEYCILAAQLDMGEQSEAELRDAFLLWSGGKEKIPKEKMHHALTMLGDKFTEAEFEAFMGDVDLDKDDTVDYNEYRRSMTAKS